VEFDTTNGSVDLIEQRIDVVLRVMQKLAGDANLKVRQITNSRRILVSAPAIASSIEDESSPLALANLSTLAFGLDDPPDHCTFTQFVARMTTC
jgi:DNA-binding transcriptional LysR family regulator